MITINNLTVRLGGRAILDRAAAAMPLNGRIGLIGRNGAGKSTPMKVLIGEPDPDQGLVEMPRCARGGYVAQEAPSGSVTPFDAVLAGDVERKGLLEQADICLDMKLLGDIHERLRPIHGCTHPRTRGTIGSAGGCGKRVAGGE